MTLVTRVGVPGQSSGVRIPESQAPNSTIVLVGENGTRKSLLLRELVHAGLGVSDAAKREHLAGPAKVSFSRQPSRVIAISATATDRFPARSRRGEASRSSKYDVESYFYVGPRSSRNIISRNHSASELVFSLLSDPEIFLRKSRFFKEVLELARVASNLSIELSPRSLDMKRLGKPQSFENYLHGVLSKELSPHKPSYIRALAERSLASTLETRFIRILDDELLARRDKWPPQRGGLQRSSIPVEYDAAAGEINASLPIEALVLALETGYLVPRRLSFGGVPEEALSAGQWAIVSSALSLASAVKDYSLVLIDEPENGLHPAWQRQYLSLLFQAIDHVKGCAIVIATHSPLIVGAAPFDCASIVALKRDGNTVRAKVETAREGWDSNAILDDVFNLPSSRNERVEALVNRALRLIAEGKRSNEQELSDLSGELRKVADRLSDSDDLRSTIYSIFRVIKEA